MITNINCIKNVGKFENCNSGSITFTDKGLIFGKNMNGKSTLTSIFSSLKESNNDLIIGRKTFGKNQDQEIIIKISGDTFIFKNNSWNKNYENLEIFDTKFISENICNTEEICFEQQKNLNGVVLGQKGRKLIIDIEILNENITELSNKKRDLTNNYFNPLLANKLFPEEFMKLENIENLDKKIKEQIKLIEQNKNKNKIVEKTKDSFFKLNLQQFEELFTKKININFKDIEKHLNENFDEESKGKKFLQDGLGLLKKDNCIFCGQKLNESAKKLIECYKKVFSEEFESLQKEINSKIEEFSSLNFEDKINNEVLEFNSLGLTIPLSNEEKKDLIKSKNIIDIVFKEKKDNIAKEINLTENNEWKKVKEKFNEILEFLNLKTNDFIVKNKTSKIEEELERLQFTQERFKLKSIEKIKEYDLFDLEIKKFQKQREEKQKELEGYAKGIFNKYKEKIDFFLKEMNANFVIDDFSHFKKIRGKDESLFCINFDEGHKINLYENEACKPNFQNTLSESDKRTLAFAFFLAKLDADEELNKKVIIFDDPISSFDKERKKKTCRLLLDVNCNNKKPKQIIVLTHQEDFMKDLIRDLDAFESKYLSLKINFGEIKIIEDMNKEFPDDEIIDSLDQLYEILETENFKKNFFVECRKILENILKRKYYPKLKSIIVSNPRASIRTFAEIIYGKESSLYKDFIRLCNDLQEPLHDNSLPKSSAGDKRTILQDFFNILEKI